MIVDDDLSEMPEHVVRYGRPQVVDLNADSVYN